MIQKLEIRNFQKHLKLNLDFDLINTITGSSDKGKSTIIRALYWVCFNKPDGESFLSFNREEVKVRVTLDRYKVSRKKGKGNYYYLNECRYTAFGRGVPETVQKTLNVDELNFQLQLDAPLWFLSSGSEVARNLNRVIRLDSIDRTAAKIASGLRKSKSHYEISSERLEIAQKRKEELKWVESALKKVNLIEEKGRNLLLLKERKEKLTSLISKIKYLEGLINTKLPLKEVNYLYSLYREKFDVEKHRNNLRDKISQIQEKEECLNTLTKELKSQESHFKKTFQKKCPLCQRPM